MLENYGTHTATNIAIRPDVSRLAAGAGMVDAASGWRIPRTSLVLWAGGDDPASPVLSPINGSLAGIGLLLIAVGTDESAHADTLLLRDRALAEGVDLEFIEKEGLPHLFMYAPIPEAKPVIDRFVERLARAAVYSYSEKNI